MASTPMVNCPFCKGAKGGMGFVCGSQCSTQWITCTICKGAGEVTEAHADHYKQAETIRRDRIDRRVTIRQEGARLGCDYAEWSRIEAGKLPETHRGYVALSLRLKEMGLDSDPHPVG